MVKRATTWNCANVMFTHFTHMKLSAISFWRNMFIYLSWACTYSALYSFPTYLRHVRNKAIKTDATRHASWLIRYTFFIPNSNTIFTLLNLKIGHNLRAKYERQYCFVKAIYFIINHSTLLRVPFVSWNVVGVIEILYANWIKALIFLHFS